MKNRLILVSNDDGIHSGGLEALIEAVHPFGKILVVAPAEGQSGMSHAITVRVPLRLHKVRTDHEDNITRYICNGTPVDCVKLALNRLVDRKPDLLITGINHGGNASASIVYSGTMAAAMEGCINGIPSIGFSLLDISRDADFSVAQEIVKNLIGKTLEEGLPDGVCLNVNIPALSFLEIKGIRISRQTRGLWKEEFDKRTDPMRRDYFWLTGQFHNLEPEADDTDEWALANDFVSVVPVKIDLTSYETIQKIKHWEKMPVKQPSKI